MGISIKLEPGNHHWGMASLGKETLQPWQQQQGSEGLQASQQGLHHDAMPHSRSNPARGLSLTCHVNLQGQRVCLTLCAVYPMQLGVAGEYLECKPATTAYDCQAGLTRSHIDAWTRLAQSGEPAAWIFE